MSAPARISERTSPPDSKRVMFISSLSQLQELVVDALRARDAEQPPAGVRRAEPADAVLVDADAILGHAKGAQWLAKLSHLETGKTVLVLTRRQGDLVDLGGGEHGDVRVLGSDAGWAGLLDALGWQCSEEDANPQRSPEPPPEQEHTRIQQGGDRSQPSAPAPSAASGMERMRPQVPGYTILKQIGRGGMSTVYLARRLEDAHEVALKILFCPAGEPQALKAFGQEYTLIATLRHANVVRVYERAFARDYAYIAMEHLVGGDLNQRIRCGIEAQEALGYLRQIALGLAAVHALDIVHRDLKPGNVVFRGDDTLAITDFGVAHALRGPGEGGHNGPMVGTPYYMSPEQCAGAVADRRSDLYSLGVIMYQMLAGRRPFAADTVDGLMKAHMAAPLPRLPDESAALQPLLDGLLAKDPDDRFQNADELLAGIDWLS